VPAPFEPIPGGIIFASDARLDSPLSLPGSPPDAISGAIGSAAMTAVAEVFDTACVHAAAAVVLCGTLLDPTRASPGQTLPLLDMIERFGRRGGVTICTAADTAAASLLHETLGSVASLRLLEPSSVTTVDFGGDPCEIECITQRRLVVRTAEARNRIDIHGLLGPEGDPAARPRVTASWQNAAREIVLPSLQARHAAEFGEGVAGILAIDHDTASPRWRTFPVAPFVWTTVTTTCSATEEEEELSVTARAEIDRGLAGDPRTHLVRLRVACESDPHRRLRVATMAPAVLAEIRESMQADGLTSWCIDVEADPGESLEGLIRPEAPAGPRRFTSMLADLAEHGDPDTDTARAAAGLDREGAWMALELFAGARLGGR